MGDTEGTTHRGDPWEASAAHRRRSGRGGGTGAEDRKRRGGAGEAKADGQGLGLGLSGRRKAEYPPGVAGGPCVGGPVDTVGALAAVVTVTFNRAEYLERHVASLLDVHGRDRSNRRGPAHIKARCRAVVRFLVTSLVSLCLLCKTFKAVVTVMFTSAVCLERHVASLLAVHGAWQRPQQQAQGAGLSKLVIGLIGRLHQHS